MKKKTGFVETYLFSAAGVVAMAVLLILLTYIAGIIHGRVDLTEEKLFTLSDGTRQILKSMDTPVTLRFYYSKDATQMPMALKNYAGRVENLLKEYRVASGGKIRVEKLNPTPDSDAEDSANLDGIAGQSVGFEDQIYLGLAISCLDVTEALPALSPGREELLEYDITRTIYRILNPKKPVVGVMSSLPVMGQQVPPQMAMMNPRQAQGTPPWLFVSELKRDFEVREIDPGVESIDADVDLLLAVHPKNLSDKSLFAIDQFVLRGGKLLAFLDPINTQDQGDQANPMQYRVPEASSLGKLLSAWGVEFKGDQVLADLTYQTNVGGRNGQPQSLPTVLSLAKEAMNVDDPATAKLDSLILPFAGVFTGDGSEKLTRTVLLRSSEQSQQVEKFMAQVPGDGIMKKFSPSDKEQALAIRLVGTFKTAFPNGLDAEGAKADDKKAEAEQDLKQGESAVVLVADADMLYDHFCVQQRQSMFGQNVAVPISDNLNLVQNLVEQMSGGGNLASIRCRGAVRRPFTVVNRMQVEAQQQYQNKINELEQELAEAENKLQQLQRSKSQDQKYILSPEQREEIAKFRETQVRVRRELKDMRKQLRRKIDALENGVKWANIALIPFLVSLGGICLAVIRRRRAVRK
jgi:ABC-type uncharacterized transport system involved in gliding motility auxiliary subunit